MTKDAFYHYSCWLADKAFYFAFMAPVCLIIVVNAVLFTLVIKGITCNRPKGLRTNQDKYHLAWLQVKAGVSCFIMLGLWLFVHTTVTKLLQLSSALSWVHRFSHVRYIHHLGYISCHMRLCLLFDPHMYMEFHIETLFNCKEVHISITSQILSKTKHDAQRGLSLVAHIDL